MFIFYQDFRKMVQFGRKMSIGAERTQGYVSTEAQAFRPKCAVLRKS
jgi:hypothetical protein